MPLTDEQKQMVREAMKQTSSQPQQETQAVSSWEEIDKIKTEREAKKRLLEKAKMQEEEKKKHPIASFLKVAGKFVGGVAKSIGETGLRAASERTLGMFDPGKQLRKEFIPETVDLPIVGETSIRYSDEPKKAVLQAGEDVLNTYVPRGAKVATRVAEDAAGYFSKKLIEKRAQDKTLDIISPYLSKKEKELAISFGRGIEGTLTEGSKISPSFRLEEIRDVADAFIDPTKGYIDNIKNVKEGISFKANSLKKYVEKIKAPYTSEELFKQFKKIEKPVTLISDNVQNKLYDLVENRFFYFVNKYPKTIDGLLNAREAFDDWAEKEIPKIWENNGKYKPVNDAIRKLRQQTNNFIAENAYHFPNVDKSPILDILKEQNLLYEAVDNMSVKAAKEFGKSGIKKIITKYPILRDIVTGLVGGAAATTLLGRE